MNNWKKTQYSDTFRNLVDNVNTNADNSKFNEEMLGTVLSNGILFTGNETIDEKPIEPLSNVLANQVVNSNTVLDNFLLYFRDVNNVVKLDMFPVDLLSYADGKLHFFFIKEDLSYRVSEYMYGGADELLLFRFVINENSTWNQIYIMAQRAGTPLYHAEEEWYEVEGMYVKSPGGLQLSQTAGNVKRSGIDFTDIVSPDIVDFFNLASESVPLRYVNTFNEINYNDLRTYNVITNKYMIYNMSSKLKIQAEKYIQSIIDESYMISSFFNNKSYELRDAINNNASDEEKQSIINICINKLDKIYSIVDILYELLGESVLSSVRRASLSSNSSAVFEYMNNNLVNIQGISLVQVTAIKNLAAYIVDVSSAVYNNPLDKILVEIQADLDLIVFDEGKLMDVPKNQFTIQRILWDVYEQTLIMQYGNKIYTTFEEAIDGTSLLDFPAPFGKSIYIPLAIMIIKSGITSINDDVDTIIIDRRWKIVDQEMSDYIDYVARAKAEKALSLASPVLNIPININILDWKSSTEFPGYKEYSVKNSNIKPDPYIIDIVFKDLTKIKSAIIPKPGAQSDGEIIIMAKKIPSEQLQANLIITKGVDSYGG